MRSFLHIPEFLNNLSYEREFSCDKTIDKIHSRNPEDLRISGFERDY